MAHYEATFEIDSDIDSDTVRLLTERAYDTIREELRQADRGDTVPNETLQQFKAICEAARHPSSGTLTLIYDRREGTFDTSTTTGR